MKSMYRHLAIVVIATIISSLLTPSNGMDAYTDGVSESKNETYKVVAPTLTPSPQPTATATIKPSPTPTHTLQPTEEPVPECPYDMKELELLAHLINGEAGSDWCSDTMQYYVGSVVLNRVKSKQFPNTMHDVIYQKGQYACTWDGNIDKEPADRCWEIAEDLLINGSVLPDKVIFQAEFKQGNGIWCKEQNMYFCYN